MKVLLKYSLIFTFCCTYFAAQAQTDEAAEANTIDSLKTILKTSKSDTNKLNILFSLMDKISDENIWHTYNEERIKLAQKLVKNNNQQVKLKGKRSLAESLNFKGIINSDQSRDSIALIYYYQSLKLWEELGDLKNNALLLNNIGNIFYDRGDVAQAIDYLEKV